MSKARLAVIGVGHLGQIHARLLRQVEHAELIAVVDPVREARERLAAELNVPALADHGELLGRIDGAIVATPSRLHYAVASDLLAHGIHVFLEKPMTLNVGDADGLIAEAESAGLVLQVGHVERFNPAFCAVKPHLAAPKYLSAVRSGPFTCRSTDIGVVLDLMIHDIDLVLDLVDDDVTSVEALGSAVIGPNEDWAQARLTFAGGGVANLFASRVAWQAQRTLDVVCRDRAARIDFGTRTAKLMRVGEAIAEGRVDVNCLDAAGRTHLKDQLFTEYLPTEELTVAEGNPLLEEQKEFVGAISSKGTVRVAGMDGRRALDVAEKVLAEIAAHRWEGSIDGAAGPRFESREVIIPGPHWHHRARLKAG
jgi:predicted dehydrogenase